MTPTTAMSRATTSARFLNAATALVEDAREQAGDVGWLITRAEGDDLIILCAAGQEPSLQEGERIHPSSDVDLLMPLELPDGTVFGALCAMGAGPEDHTSVPRPLLNRLVAVLRTMLAAEWDVREAQLRAETQARRAEHAEQEALTDALTSVGNRRAWDRAIEAEERRRRRYGGNASILVVDVDGLKEINDTQGHLGGDLLLRMTAGSLDTTSRDSDLVCRIGGDEFGVLALDCDNAHLRILVSRVRRALETQGVEASVGGATRKPGAGMEEAWAEADAAMYEDKASRGRGSLTTV